jgi:tetratricopeptide (TPR) repeat protein
MNRIATIQEYLLQSPNDSFLLHALALEYIKIADDKKAEEIFLNLLSMNENYLGSYYHLAKLFERNNNFEKAIKYYNKGIEIAKLQKDNHALNELRAALEDIEE